MKWLLSRRRSKALKAPSSTWYHHDTISQRLRYDVDTGQIFAEQIAPILTSCHDGWAKQGSGYTAPPGCTLPYREYLDWQKSGLSGEELDVKGITAIEGTTGARSLTDTVLEFLVQNLEDITPEALESLPPQVVRRLWHEVDKRCEVYFDTWKMFSKVLHKEVTARLNLLRFRQYINEPVSPLSVYVEPLMSPSFDFISSLSITTEFPLQDLVRLSKVTTLGVLEIVNPGDNGGDRNGRPNSGVGDRLVKAWAKTVSDDVAFPLLRILKLWNHQGVTIQSLEYVNIFPSLALFDVSGCKIQFERAIKEAQKYGWKTTRDYSTFSFLEAACRERATMMQAALGIEAEPIRKKPSSQLLDRARVTRMPRADIPKFLTRPEASRPRQSHEVNSNLRMSEDSDYMNPELGYYDWRRREMENHLEREDWEFYTLSSYAKIGELRDDRDLAAAGVDIGDQPMVGDELLPPLPVASLRLGRTISPRRPQLVRGRTTRKPLYPLSIKDYPEPDQCDQHISFIRIKLPFMVATSPDMVNSFGTAPFDKKAVPTKAEKRPGSSGVRESKKQKLATVLGSLLYP